MTRDDTRIDNDENGDDGDDGALGAHLRIRAVPASTRVSGVDERRPGRSTSVLPGRTDIRPVRIIGQTMACDGSYAHRNWPCRHVVIGKKTPPSVSPYRR